MVIDQGLDVAQDFRIASIRGRGNISQSCALFMVNGCWLRMKDERHGKQSLQADKLSFRKPKVAIRQNNILDGGVSLGDKDI